MKYPAIVLVFLLIPSLAFSQEEIRIPVSDFDPKQLSEDVENPKWSELKLPRRDPTSYTLIDSSDQRAIKAESDNSASGLVYKVDIDPAEYPILEWSWRVDSPVKNGNYKTKKGDDYAARIYITFDYNKRKLKLGDRLKYETFRTFSRFPIPLRALNYIWANEAKIGTIAPNAYTKWVYMIAVKSGTENTELWQIESRNIYEDYVKAFGENPPKINGIAIMTDTDNTKGLASALYGDIIFRMTDSK